MDHERFDALTRLVAASATRRAALGGLLGAGLAEFFGSAEARKRHKGQGKRRKRCTPKSKAKTCAGRCGVVRNNCKKRVDCGPCACEPACGVCRVCDDRTGQCVPDPSQQGDECGAQGQVCQSDGTCRCDATSCAPCAACQADGRCGAPCEGVGCCDAAGVCQPGTTDAACGTQGGECATCTGFARCQGGACRCVPTTCAAAGKECGTIGDGCGNRLDCGDCPACQRCDAGTGGCVADPSQDGASCDSGDVCAVAQCQGGACAGQPKCTRCEDCDASDGTCSLKPGYSFCVANPTFPPPRCGGTVSEPCICLGSVCSRAPDFIACTPDQSCTTTGGVPGTCVVCPNPYTAYWTACAPPCPS